MTKTGVVIGKFNNEELTDFHMETLDYVKERVHKLVIVVIESGLDFDDIKEVILQSYPSAIVLYFPIRPFSNTTSQKLDSLLSEFKGVEIFGYSKYLKNYTGDIALREFEKEFA